MDRAAKAMIELLFANDSSRVLHLENPTRQPWSEILGALSSSLGISMTLPYEQWLDKVTPFVLYRWLGTAGLLSLFMLRIVFAQGVSFPSDFAGQGACFDGTADCSSPRTLGCSGILVRHPVRCDPLRSSRVVSSMLYVLVIVTIRRLGN